MFRKARRIVTVLSLTILLLVAAVALISMQGTAQAADRSYWDVGLYNPNGLGNFYIQYHKGTFAGQTVWNWGVFPDAQVFTGDFDGDGYGDVGLYDANGLGGLDIQYGDGAGTFGDQTTDNWGHFPDAQVYSGDYDGDGYWDIGLYNPNGLGNFYIRYGDGAGSFGEETAYNWGATDTPVFSGDFDGDGYWDIGRYNPNGLGNFYVRYGDGSGSFGEQTVYAWGVFPDAQVFAGDFDADGYGDIGLYNPNGEGRFYIRYGDGSGSFGRQTDWRWGTYIDPLAFSGDFDGDGYWDVGLYNPNSLGNFYIQYGNHPGTFGSQTDYDWGHTPTSKVFSGDFDGDGYGDIGRYNPNGTGSFFIRYGDGSGSFGRQTDWNWGVFPDAQVFSGDFDGDGYGDVGLYDANGLGGLDIQYGDGAGTFGDQTTDNWGHFPDAQVFSGDFDGDGYWDIGLYNPNGFGDFYIRYGDGAGSFGGETAYDWGGVYDTPVFSGDFDADGYWDIGLYNPNGMGNFYIRYGEGNGSFADQTQWAWGVFPDAQVFTGDFDRDIVPQYGLSVAPEESAQAGDPGTTVTHTLEITNTGNVTDSFAVDVSGNGWTTTASPPAVDNLGPSAPAMVSVAVAIPAGADQGATDEAELTFTSSGDASQTVTVTLSTAADVEEKIYLPMFFSN